MALTDREAQIASAHNAALGDIAGLAEQINVDVGNEDTQALVASVGGLLDEWDLLYDLLLGGDPAPRGDPQTAAEKIALADEALQLFRLRATELSQILAGLNLPLVTIESGDRASLGSLILDLVGGMGSIVVLLNEASRQLSPSPSKDQAKGRVVTIRRAAGTL